MENINIDLELERRNEPPVIRYGEEEMDFINEQRLADNNEQ